MLQLIHINYLILRSRIFKYFISISRSRIFSTIL